MEALFPVWFGISAIFSVAVTVFLLWLAWMLVTSVKGIREELERIRKLLESRQV